MENIEYTQIWNKDNRIDALSRSTVKSRMEYYEDQYELIIYIRALQVTVTGS